MTFLKIDGAAFKCAKLSRDEEQECSRKFAQGDVQAGDRLILGNIPFAIGYARKYRSFGFPFADLIQIAVIGLLRARRKFKVQANVKFLTYAEWWIRAELNRYVLENWSQVKFGSTAAQRKIFFNRTKIKRRVDAAEGNGENGVVQVAAELGVRPDELGSMLQRMVRDIPYQEKFADGIEPTSAGLAGVTDPETLFAAAEIGRVRRESIGLALARLTEREALVIRSRYLCDQDEARTLQDLADEFGLSRERVRQIEEEAKGKLRVALWWSREDIE